MAQHKQPSANQLIIKLQGMAVVFAFMMVPVAVAGLFYQSAVDFTDGSAPVELQNIVGTVAISPDLELIVPGHMNDSQAVSKPVTEKTVEWWNEEDVSLLAALISAESRGEPYQGQLAVGCVVLNRLEDGSWGDNISSVIYSPGQFAAPYWDYSESEYTAALECLAGQRILPEGVLFFQVCKVNVWFGADWYCTIGNHNFYLKED